MKTAEDGSSGVNGARGRHDDYEKQYRNWSSTSNSTSIAYISDFKMLTLASEISI